MTARPEIADRLLVEHALAYAQNLGRVFPIPVPNNPETKKAAKKIDPQLPWAKNATADPATLRQWFGAAALIAPKGGTATPPNILCTPHPGLLVLDVDLPDGPKSLEAFEAQHSKLPNTLAARTPSGGLHLWFRIDPALKVGSPSGGDTGPYAGLDIRSSGDAAAGWAGAGCAMMTPSIRPPSPGTDDLPGNEAGAYSWINWDPLSGKAPHIADAPQWVIDYAVKGAGKRKGAKRCGSAGNFEDWERQIDEAGKDWRAQKAVIASLALDGGLDAGDHDDLLDHAKRVSGKRIGRLRQTLKDAQRERTPDDGRPVIDVSPGKQGEAVRAAIAELAKLPYTRIWGGKLVDITGGHLRAIVYARLTTILSDAAVFRAGDRPKDPPKNVVEGVLAEPELPGVPIIMEWHRQPCALGNVTTPGHRDGVEAFFDPADFPEFTRNAEVLARVPEALRVHRYGPVDEIGLTAAEAMSQLRWLLSGSGFASLLDEAGALALLITAVARPALPNAVGFVISASKSRAGKSEIAELAGLLASAETLAAVDWGDKKEQADTINSMSVDDRPVIWVDNLERGSAISHPRLEAFMTARASIFRGKHTNDMRDASTRKLVIFTGNAIGVVADSTMRFIPINITPHKTRAQIRAAGAPPHPRKMVEANRGYWVQIVNAILAHQSDIICHDPDVTRHSSFDEAYEPLDGYHDWHYTVRRALVVAGLPDPVQAIMAQKEDDPEAAASAEVARACAVYFVFEALELTPMWERVEEASMGAASSAAAAADEELTYPEMWSCKGEHSLFNPGFYVKEARRYAVKQALRAIGENKAGRFDSVAAGKKLTDPSAFGDFRLVESTRKSKHKGAKRYQFEPVPGSASAPHGALEPPVLPAGAAEPEGRRRTH